MECACYFCVAFLQHDGTAMLDGEVVWGKRVKLLMFGKGVVDSGVQ